MADRRHTAQTDADGVITSGWLYKMTPSSMSVSTKFKKRWFMVQNTPDGQQLTYCKAPDDPELTKTAPLVTLIAALPPPPIARIRRAPNPRPCFCCAAALCMALVSQKINEVLTVHEGFSEGKYSCGMEHCEFQISTEHKTILFRAMTSEERDMWVSLLRPTMQGYLLKSRLTQQLKLQTRWFVLKAGKLYYFKSPTDTKSCKAPFAVHSIVTQTKAESGSADERCAGPKHLDPGLIRQSVP